MFEWLWAWLNGKKTYIASIVGVLVAVEKAVDVLPPEVEEALIALVIALGFYGMRQAVRTETQAAAEAVVSVQHPTRSTAKVKKQVTEAIEDAKEPQEGAG